MESEKEFVVEMIPHHQEAVDASLIVVERSTNQDVVALAGRIVVAQQAEIEMMNSWLDQYYGGGYEPEYHEMMSDMSTLSGSDLDVAFLEEMIDHHRMGIMRAEEVLDLNPQKHVEEFAENLIDTQSGEIQEMEELLADY